MADVLRSFADRLTCTLIVVYSDNIAVLAPQREAHATAKLFREAFRTHGAGPFDLRISVTPIDREIRFLGYSWRVEGGTATPHVPAPKARAWTKTVEQSIYRACPSDLADIKQHVRGWCGSHDLWEGAPLLQRHLLALIERMEPVTHALAAEPLVRDTFTPRIELRQVPVAKAFAIVPCALRSARTLSKVSVMFPISRRYRPTASLRSVVFKLRLMSDDPKTCRRSSGTRFRTYQTPPSRRPKPGYFANSRSLIAAQ